MSLPSPALRVRNGRKVEGPRCAALVRCRADLLPLVNHRTARERHQGRCQADTVGESDRWEHKPLCEAIVLKAGEAQFAGTTVLRGPMGYGKSSRLHTAKILRLSSDLSIVIEIVDSEEKLNTFLPMLDSMIGGGLVTLEKVRVIKYRGRTGSVLD